MDVGYVKCFCVAPTGDFSGHTPVDPEAGRSQHAHLEAMAWNTLLVLEITSLMWQRPDSHTHTYIYIDMYSRCQVTVQEDCEVPWGANYEAILWQGQQEEMCSSLSSFLVNWSMRFFVNWSSPTVVKVGSKELKSTQEYPGHFGLAVSWLETTDGRFLNPVHVYKYSMPV